MVSIGCKRQLLAAGLGLVLARGVDGRETITLPAANLGDGEPRPRIDGLVTDEAWAKVEPMSTFTHESTMTASGISSSPVVLSMAVASVEPTILNL